LGDINDKLLSDCLNEVQTIYRISSKDGEVVKGPEFFEAVKKHINPNFSERKKNYLNSLFCGRL